MPDTITPYMLGSHEITAQPQRTLDLYKDLPLITDNCTCFYCQYFGSTVVKKDIEFFRHLSDLGVILARQADIPGSLSCVGETENFELGYIGNYCIYGSLASEENIQIEERSDHHYCSYTITPLSEDILEFSFWLEVGM